MNDFTAIETFVRVVDCGSFRAAARELHTTSSALSKRVGRLEQDLGARLLYRTTRHLSLTHVGKLFYDGCAGLLLDYQELQQTIGELQEVVRGTLRISVPADLTVDSLGPELSRFCGLYPQLEVEVNVTDRLVNVVEDRYDAVIRISNLPDSTLISRRLCGCGIMLCASPEYLTRKGTPKTPDDLNGHDIIGYAGQQAPLRFRDASYLAATDARIRVDSGILMRRLAIDGLGLAPLPGFLAMAPLRSGELVEVLAQQLESDLGVHVLYPHRKLVSPAVRALVEFLQQHLVPKLEWGQE